MAVTQLYNRTTNLNGLIEYVMNGDKTDEMKYVSAVNCLPETAYEEMIATIIVTFITMSALLPSSLSRLLITYLILSTVTKLRYQTSSRITVRSTGILILILRKPVLSV